MASPMKLNPFSKVNARKRDLSKKNHIRLIYTYIYTYTYIYFLFFIIFYISLSISKISNYGLTVSNYIYLYLSKVNKSVCIKYEIRYEMKRFPLFPNT